jgi:hypothetical protein
MDFEPGSCTTARTGPLARGTSHSGTAASGIPLRGSSSERSLIMTARLFARRSGGAVATPALPAGTQHVSGPEEAHWMTNV